MPKKVDEPQKKVEEEEKKQITGKLADHQKVASILGVSLLKQSESLQCKFLWESLAVPLTANSLAV